jgi:hypothetical protein
VELSAKLRLDVVESSGSLSPEMLWWDASIVKERVSCARM